MTARATEAQCQATIVEAAKMLGWRVHAERAAGGGRHGWRTPIQGHAGFPDLVLVRGAELLVVELKRKPNRLEPAQVGWLDALRVAGVQTAVVWVPEGMQTFIDQLARRAT